MKTRLILASLAAATAMTLAMPAFSADDAQTFVNKAAVGGMFEVESSKIADGKLTDQTVNDFAAKMIGDHGAANAKLETVAAEQKLTVPKELDAKHQSDVDALASAPGPVDGPYVEMQRAAHAEAVALFESYAQDGDNPQLKAFAQETLPTLKMHQEMVDKLAANVGGTTTTANTPAVSTTDTANPSAPVPGANSFTEDQAKSRIQDAGFADVGALTKDENGIWRGQATKDGKSVEVALDFQGNVVAGAN